MKANMIDDEEAKGGYSLLIPGEISWSLQWLPWGARDETRGTCIDVYLCEHGTDHLSRISTTLTAREAREFAEKLLQFAEYTAAKDEEEVDK